MHNNGNGKRWLLIGLLVLGGFWLVNDAYDDGYRDALVASGQGQSSALRRYHDGPDFPWGLLILGGIGYVAWRKGAFDRFGGPGGPFGPSGNGGFGQRGVQRYGVGNGPTHVAGQESSPVFRGPRAFFEEWHRQAHEEAARAQYPTPPAPPAPPTGAPNPNHDGSQGGFAATPPPTPPAPEYWASMAGAAQAAGAPGTAMTPPAAPEARQDEHPDVPRDATGTAV